MAVLDPIKLVITNLDEAHEESIEFANHPKNPDFGTRHVPFSRESWIERDDFAEIPPKGFHRLVPNGEVRLRGVGIVRCEEVVKNADGSIRELRCTLDATTRHGLPGADRKIKGTIHWVSARHAIAAEVRLYERLFTVPDPDDTSDGKTYAEHLNRDSKRVVQGWLEPSLAEVTPESNVQFERLGYFVADRHDHSGVKPVFNRTATLRDSYATR
jgi:glutaminyl-tRNA synthetase